MRASMSLSLRNAVRLLTRGPRGGHHVVERGHGLLAEEGRRRRRPRTELVSLWHHYGLQIQQWCHNLGSELHPQSGKTCVDSRLRAAYERAQSAVFYLRHYSRC